MLYGEFSDLVTRITDLDKVGLDESAGQQLALHEGVPLGIQIKSLADKLVADAQAATDSLIVVNRSSLAASQNLFIAFALGSIALALLLGYVLSWSIVGPIRRMQARLAAIASGDFSGHVEVSNRDELVKVQFDKRAAAETLKLYLGA